jgi:acyl-CoA synthetase (AMP-forming)/AMP-acid ligase II
MAERSLTTLLEQRANRRPGGTANTFIDYEVNPAGVAESRSTTLRIIIGRVDGSNHYPDDIEATIQEITGHKVHGVGHEVQIRNGGFLVCGRDSTMTEPSLASLLRERASRPEVVS